MDKPKPEEVIFRWKNGHKIAIRINKEPKSKTKTYNDFLNDEIAKRLKGKEEEYTDPLGRTKIRENFDKHMDDKEYNDFFKKVDKHGMKKMYKGQSGVELVGNKLLIYEYDGTTPIIKIMYLMKTKQYGKLAIKQIKEVGKQYGLNGEAIKQIIESLNGK